jgi:hypothetical protein
VTLTVLVNGSTAGSSPALIRLALVALAGLAVAVAGALGPAVWAAYSNTATSLHPE